MLRQKLPMDLDYPIISNLLLPLLQFICVAVTESVVADDEINMLSIVLINTSVGKFADSVVAADDRKSYNEIIPAEKHVQAKAEICTV